MEKILKYRVKVVVDNDAYPSPETKYVIQFRNLFGWWDYSKEVTNKDWAYRTCEELNTPYEEARANVKKK